MVGVVGAQQRRSGHGGRGCRGNLRRGRRTRHESVRAGIDFRDSASGQPGDEEFGNGGDSPRLDPGPDRYGLGQLAVHLQGGTDRDRGERGTGRIWRPFRPVRGGVGRRGCGSGGLQAGGGGVGVGAGVGGVDQPRDSGGGGLEAVRRRTVGGDLRPLVSLRDSHVPRIGGWKLSHQGVFLSPLFLLRQCRKRIRGNRKVPS